MGDDASLEVTEGRAQWRCGKGDQEIPLGNTDWVNVRQTLETRALWKLASWQQTCLSTLTWSMKTSGVRLLKLLKMASVSYAKSNHVSILVLLFKRKTFPGIGF